MNKDLGFQLAVYGLLVVFLGYLAHYLSPATARITLITGLIGGILCLVWGIRAALGHCGKECALLTLIPMSFVMLSQAIICWAGQSQEISDKMTVAAVTTLILVLSVGMLIRIAYSGVTTCGHGQIPARRTGNA